MRRDSVNYAVSAIVLDVAATLASLWLATAIRASGKLPFFRSETIGPEHVPPTLYLLVAVLWAMIFVFASVYDPSRTGRVGPELQRVTGATIASLLVLAGLLYFGYRLLSRGLFAVFALLDLLFLIGWRLLLRASLVRQSPGGRDRRVLMVGSGEFAAFVYRALEEGSGGREVLGYVGREGVPDMPEFLGPLDACREVVIGKRIEEVVTALTADRRQDLESLIRSLQDLPVRIQMVPDYLGLALYRARVEELEGLPLISLRAPALNEVQRLLKRILDLVAASLLLVLSAPLFAWIALAIRLDSRGPVIFRQTRVGENGRLFPMLKFRSMVAGAEQCQDELNRLDAEGRLVHKHPRDPRITRVGRWLRRTSLDELPQLWNVLRGDMSLVGPRPELPWLVEKYDFWQRKRFAVPQGLTGWWQIHERSNRVLHHHTEDDLFYIQNYSLWLDLYILLRTPWAVFRGLGAY